ncbi:hypothetical protein G7Y89_g4431 [Cudoniella acicularis]|uniref:Uncharacterized protein n=1 Tax=Cudoniella acicularis TaxID=354080 RepID=A0A8H4W4A8_9HELO|nr:hypothetical protein G7Y89_g4431 [Cudoniella acicularis]
MLFKFPREIRNAIYSYAVTSPSPVIAWCGPITSLSQLECWQRHVYGNDCVAIEDYKLNSLPVQLLARNLICSNGQIAKEAAIIFYRKNSFLFVGDYTWEDATKWLENIGPSNRNCLARIEMNFRKPPHVWQQLDGTRIVLLEDGWQEYNRREPIFERNIHLILSDKAVDGVVKNINPAVESFFRLLGTGDESSVLVSMHLSNQTLPGLQLTTDEQHPYANWLSMDLPNLTERFCSFSISGVPKSRPIEVIWKGNESIVAFDAETRKVEEKGWEIVDAVGKEKCDWAENGIPYLEAFFTLRRKEIIGVIMADEPSPYSWLNGSREWVDAYLRN